MATAQNDFEKWLASFPEERLIETLEEYVQLAAEYQLRAEETRALLALRQRLIRAKQSRDGNSPSAASERLFSVLPARRSSLADAVVAVVGEDEEPLSAREIFERLDERGWAPRGKTPINSIHATTSRLVRAGRLAREGKKFRLPEDREGG